MRSLTLAVAILWGIVFGVLIYLALQIAPWIDNLRIPIR
jgi:hypothetical protein